MILSCVAVAAAQDDAEYTKKIKEYTTESFFSTPLVDHLPASRTVPSPLKFFGTIVGAPNVLHRSYEINDYMRALDKASDRVQVISIGMSEGGKEMIAVLVSDPPNLKKIERYKQITATLGDPRRLAPGTKFDSGSMAAADAAAEKLIAQGLPIYWLTGGMHSPESGPPEMLMELAYRLAVEDTPMIKGIRKNTIVMITPVIETDGRDRYVDTYLYRKKNPAKPAIPLIYWGKYVAHDNNRDGMAISLALSKNIMATWMDFKPQVMHDLHESVPFLYISTGTGPYNAWLDPITIGEWQEMAYNEINKLTAWGIPGVWTYGFYDGWAPNYAFYAANGHNAIGRFYETQGGQGADTRIITVGEQSQRAWFRPNPPYSRVRWSIRNNTNLMQSGVLLALENVANNKEKYLRSYYLKSKRSVLKARTEGPAAWVLPAGEERTAEQQMLLSMLDRQGVEIQKLEADVETRDGKMGKGSYVIRMDQPYSRMADMMLDKQYYSPTDPRPYDDTGWTLPLLFNVQSARVKDQAILDAPMSEVRLAAEPAQKQPMFSEEDLAALEKTRIALVHTWQSTQDEGWFRMAFDTAGVRYSYISVQDIRDTPNLKDRFDVIVLSPTGGSAQSIVNGISKEGEPIPWKPLEGFPNLGGPAETDNIRGGMELQGVLNLEKFLSEGGLLITVGGTGRVPIDYGLISGVSIEQPQNLVAPGGVFKTTNAASSSPVLKGYGQSLPVYYSTRSLLLAAGGGFGGGGRPGAGQGRASGRGDASDPDVIQGRPPYNPTRQPGDEEGSPFGQGQQQARLQVLLRFAPASELLLSGSLDKGEELGGRPALVLAPAGKGNVLLFGFNPMWRQQTQGSWRLIFNAAINWQKLRPERAAGGAGGI